MEKINRTNIQKAVAALEARQIFIEKLSKFELTELCRELGVKNRENNFKKIKSIWKQIKVSAFL